LGKPTLVTSVMRFCWTTMSIGPRGGAPVPSITVIPRITRRSNGPSPSPACRFGVGFICWAESESTAIMQMARAREIERTVRGIIASGKAKYIAFAAMRPFVNA
jgi:hypothetical protein